jgi:hypothetical protein
MVLAEKCRVIFSGVAFNNFGGSWSRGPPWGNWRFAHPKLSKMAQKTQNSNPEKGGFLFNMVFKRYNRFFYFDEL